MDQLPRYSASEFYRRLHTGNPGDVEFYLRACTGAQSVLELGVGWGRIALPLAQAGYQVVGVDQEPEFLAWARTAAAQLPPGQLQLHQADLSQFTSTQKFDRVLLPYNTLYSLPHLEQVQQLFQQIAHFLHQEGELWLDVYAMDDFQAAFLRGEIETGDVEAEEVTRWQEGEHAVVVYEKTHLFPAEQRLLVEYEAHTGSQIVGAQSLEHHYFLLEELLQSLSAAGLEVEAIWGDFAGASWSEEADHLILCARLPQA